MTPEREREIRAVAKVLGPDSAVGVLLTEVVRLRNLPVMDMCNRCDDCMPTDHNTGEAACAHPEIGDRPVVANAEPPAWCPLRGAR